MYIKDIELLCRNKAKEYGYILSCPIIVNSRLKTTLARVCFVKRKEVCKVEKIEFSKSFIETFDEKNVISVALHELAHALCILETGENHGHDALFKNWCDRLGTIQNSTRVKSLAPDKATKYSLYCEKCGFIKGYKRICPTIERATSGVERCKCGGKITATRNW